MPCALTLEGRWPQPDLAARWAPHALSQDRWKRQLRCCWLPALHAALRRLPRLLQQAGTMDLHGRSAY